jgi:transposase
LNKADAFNFMRMVSCAKQPVFSRSRARRLFSEIAELSKDRETKNKQGKKINKDIEWIHNVICGKISKKSLRNDFGWHSDFHIIAAHLSESRLTYRNRAIAVLARLHGISGRTIASALSINRQTVYRAWEIFDKEGIGKLCSPKQRSNRKANDSDLKSAIFSTLHEPPSNYGINRTSWTMAHLREVLSQKGQFACRDVIRAIIREAGYKWCRARVVLTSNDPDYSNKLERIQSILSNLRPDEAFFSIDEFGPFAVKAKAGRVLCAPGQTPVVPQWQKSKGCLILTAALELSSNQVTHFYSSKKNTEEMIRTMDLLLDGYAHKKKIYLSWDAASWHISKRLFQKIEENNQKVPENGGPIVDTAPLPARAQFLNVIESIFSGMARAIIHNSDYKSVDDAKTAIDRYFTKRNQHFRDHPRRAGNKIWGKERVPPTFSAANNCKDPKYN